MIFPTEGALTMADKPVFRVVDNVDPSTVKKLPQLEMMTASVSNPAPVVSNQTASKNQNGLTIVDKAIDDAFSKASQAPDKCSSMRNGYFRPGSFVGYPPLPALIIGLFLLIIMLLGD